MAKKTVKTDSADSVGEVSPEIIGYIFGGRLFTDDFLAEKIIPLADDVGGEGEYRIDDVDVERLYGEVKSIVKRFTSMESKGHIELNEDETQEKIIYPILDVLDWRNRTVKKSLSLSPADMRQVPDGLLFMDEESENKIYEENNKKTPYRFGKVVLENKKWRLPLETSQERLSAPAIQILSYLNRASVVSDNKIQWGFLTNGIEWRLYYQQAQSVAEQFFSVNLERLFGFGEQSDLLALDISDEDRLKCFKIFLLIFGKQAFGLDKIEYKSFHQASLAKVKFYQQQITDKITGNIFEEVFGKLAKTIAEQFPESDGEQIKHATLKLLYRILFILYAEDRDLLPMDNPDYRRYSLRDTVRFDIYNEITVSKQTTKYWCILKSLFAVINNGEPLFGVPNYNGGLFKDDDVPLLSRIEIFDAVMLDIIRPLSHIDKDPTNPHFNKKTYINYKNLNVEQLGSIYEQLLERNIIKQSGKSEIVVSAYDRRDSGSYYTPEELVNLVIRQTIDPLYQKHIDVFNSKVRDLDGKEIADLAKGEALVSVDPAEAILQQKICDPSMGSGHFLVTLIDRLTDQAIKAIGQAENSVSEKWHYKSPLRQRIEETRKTIQDNADKGGYVPNPEHLKDNHIVKRMVIKRCIYGVDKNSMAVELAKLALWLHTFTVGAPLSFLDHHLKCGDSLFGLRVNDIYDKKFKLLNILPYILKIIEEATSNMERINRLTDVEIEQVKESEYIYDDVQTITKPLKKLLSFLHAFDWFKYDNNKQQEKRLKNLQMLIDGQLGDPIEILSNTNKIPKDATHFQEILELIEEVQELSQEEQFFHWQIEFPEVWRYDKSKAELMLGGFDAVVGNPPWDRIKLQEVEWFADRDPDIAKSPTQAKRKAKIKQIKKNNTPLYDIYEKAKNRAKTSKNVIKKSGIYKEDLKKGDVNIYKIFVERSRQLISDEGFVSLVVPSGIASDEKSSPFFKKLVENKQLISFYDFQNNASSSNDDDKQEIEYKKFFNDVGPQIKFCVFTHTRFNTKENAKYGCFLQRIEDLDDGDKCFSMSAEDFNLVNPNTGTAPIFRSQRDKDLITSIYQNNAILETDKPSNWQSSWNLKYMRMLDATNDSGLLKNKTELKNMGAYPIENNRYKNKEGVWLPVYQGKMFNLHDHRAATIISNPDNLHIQRQPVKTEQEKYNDPNYFPEPYYWVLENDQTARLKQDWVMTFRNNARSNDIRTFITAILPKAAYENSGPILINKNNDKKEYLLYANFSTIPFDYIARTKIHDVNMNKFILRQLPVIDVPVYSDKKFGNKTAEELIRGIILELVYTAHNLESFAIDLGYIDDNGKAKKPFAWDEHRRLSLCAKLDAIYFILYGITEDDDIDYIYSTFKTIKIRQKKKFKGTYKSLELCKNYKNALLNEDSDIFFDV